MFRFRLALFILALAVGTTLLYHALKPEWVKFREGEHAFAAGEFQAAARAYGEAWSKGLRIPALVGNYHQSLIRTGQASSAADVFRASYQERFFLPVAEVLLEQTLAIGASGTALELARDWTARHPHHREARLTAARLYGRLGLYEQAEREYRIALGETKP